VFLPETEPVTAAAVKKLPYVGSELDDDENERLDGIVAAVNSFLRDLPVSDRVRVDTTQEDANLLSWPPRIVEGGLMLAGRLWRRKDTPGGVSVLGDQGAVYVRRNDPDVALLLELGEHGIPAAG
jgi:hypothetical protein